MKTDETRQTLVERVALEEDSEPETTCTKLCRACKLLFFFVVFSRLAFLFFSAEENSLQQNKPHEAVFNQNNPSTPSNTASLFCPDPQNSTNPEPQYTLVVSTFNRDNELIKNLDHWLSCPSVYQVQVVWHSPTRSPPSTLFSMQEQYNCTNSHPRLLIRTQTQDKLSNRFRIPLNGFPTEAVFNIDDDAVIDCRLMSLGFEKWNSMGSMAMVGFEPRQISWEGDGQGYYWYQSCDTCEYNTLWPTKGAFLHRSFYAEYFKDEYAPVRKLVDKYFTGEDILMTFVHFSTLHKKNTSNPPPILSIQATSDFKRTYFDKKDRFSLLEKLLNLPETLLFKTGIEEVKSLGVRSSWFRGKVHSGIGALAAEKQVPMPPMRNTWAFLAPNGTGFEAEDVCSDSELFEALQCSTKFSLTPLSAKDAELMLCSILLAVFSVVLGVRAYLNHRAKLAMYEQVRRRKISYGSPSELALGQV